MKLEPILLTHPNIPRPLHGLAPREIKGRAWWDKVRREVYAERDQHCFACGVHRTQAWPNRWLECHEDYEIDYAKGRMEIKRLVALCPACHGFIHSGRLAIMRIKGVVHSDMVRRIMNHGYEILRANGLMPSLATTILIQNGDLCEPDSWCPPHILIPQGFALAPDWKIGDFAPWAEWRLVFEGKEYEPLWKSEDEWAAHYGR